MEAVINEIYGRLKVISLDTSKPERQYLCECQCGRLVTVRGRHLLSGHTKSCGCYLKDRITKHGMWGTPIYNVWTAIKDRCNNPNCLEYKNYGARGISYDKRWELFSNFYEDMCSTYQTGLQLDRIDNDGNYSKDNCRWTTPQKNSNNKRNNHLLTINGETHTVTEWSRIMGFKPSCIPNRIARGWDNDKLLKPIERIR
jgi:hypothetical protein